MNNIMKKSVLGLDFTCGDFLLSGNKNPRLDLISQSKPQYCVLPCDSTRAIPEEEISAIRGLNCEPILRFFLPLQDINEDYEIQSLLDAYSRWGVTRIIFFDRPNAIPQWGSQAWLQQDLVNRFLDRFLMLGGMAVNSGITPVFPPLDPAGNYSDRIFLSKSLESIMRRNPAIAEKLEISALAWTYGHALEWGAGGESCNSMDDPADDERARGFRISDWYDQICDSIYQKSLPIHLLQAGITCNTSTGYEWENSSFMEKLLSLIHFQAVDEPENSVPLGECVFSCNLAIPPRDHALRRPLEQKLASLTDRSDGERDYSHNSTTKEGDHGEKPIKLYVLLPAFDWGVSDWYFDAIRSFVKTHRPAIGFSVHEARFADKVIVLNERNCYSSSEIDSLRAAGCQVEEMTDVGTSVATILATR